MKIKILISANQDLIDGYWFYEKQAEGLGPYFLDTLFSDIDSLKIFAGTHPIHFGNIIVHYQNVSLLLFIIALKPIQCLYMRFLIVVEVLHG